MDGNKVTWEKVGTSITHGNHKISAIRSAVLMAPVKDYGFLPKIYCYMERQWNGGWVVRFYSGVDYLGFEPIEEGDENEPDPRDLLKRFISKMN
jgi:hypothetical protein